MSNNWRTPKMEDFANGFKYQVWVGYEWVDVEYPKNGIAKSQLLGAINNSIVRCRIDKNNNQA